MPREERPGRESPLATRLTLVTPALRMGGAERVLVTLANYWAEQGWHVTIVSLDDTRKPAYGLNPDVTVRGLDLVADSHTLVASVTNNLRRLRVLRQALRATGPDAVIAFQTVANALAIVSLLGTSTPVIVSERVDPRHVPLNRAWALLRRVLYPRTACLAVQTQRVLDQYSFVPHRAVIPNPVVPAPQSAPHTGSRRIVGLGRLVPQKGFDLLIGAFASIADRYPDWTLEIWGEGPQREELQDLASSSGIGARVTLAGRTDRPYDALARGEIFVFSSRFEGFPNTLCEAMAAGLPVVSFDCESGPREIIRNGVDGLLVETGDVAGLGEAMSTLMGNPDLRSQMSKRAREISQRFALQDIAHLWEDAIQAARQRGRGRLPSLLERTPRKGGRQSAE